MYGDMHQDPLSQNIGLNRAQNWQLKFCWFPERCFLTNKKLWLKYAYRGMRLITGPGEPIEESYWLDKTAFVVWRLKG